MVWSKENYKFDVRVKGLLNNLFAGNNFVLFAYV